MMMLNIKPVREVEKINLGDFKIDEIEKVEFDKGRGYGVIPELDNLRTNFPSDLEGLKNVIYQVISNRTNRYDDLTLRAIKELESRYKFKVTYQFIRYFVLSELTKKDRSAINLMYDQYGKAMSRIQCKRFRHFLKRQNIGIGHKIGYYTKTVGASYSKVYIKRIINPIELRKPYSAPNLVMYNLIYIIEKCKNDGFNSIKYEPATFYK